MRCRKLCISQIYLCFSSEVDTVKYVDSVYEYLYHSTEMHRVKQMLTVSSVYINTFTTEVHRVKSVDNVYQYLF